MLIREKSNQLFNEANNFLVGGVSASWNSFSNIGPTYFEKGFDSKIIDVDGNQYIDYIMGWGSLFIGHNPKIISSALDKVRNDGFGFQYETSEHVKLAKKMVSMIPGIEKVRLCNSGTEATMHSIRLARSYTGKSKIIKFEGHFHGLHDYVLYNMDSSPKLNDINLGENTLPVPGSSGIPQDIESLVIPLPFNNIDMFVESIDRNANEVAAVIMEPISLNIGCIYPTPEFINIVREKCTEHNIVLIFDEVLTGFRVGRGGSQEYLGIEADICCYGKALGSGMPIAAIAGKEKFMKFLVPEGHSQMSGTNTGRRMSVIATNAVLEYLDNQKVYDYIWMLNDKLCEGLRYLLDKHGVPAYINGAGGRIGIHIGLEDAPKDYRDIIKKWNRDYTVKLFEDAMLNKGLYGFFLPMPNAPEPVTLSVAHTIDDIDETLNRVEAILASNPYEVKK